jgi:hypothetical protein
MNRRLALVIALGTAALGAFRFAHAAHLGRPITGTLGSGTTILAALLTALVPAWLATRSRWRGTRLAAGLFALAFGVGSFNNVIEAVLFGVLPRGMIVTALLPSAVLQLLLAGAIAWAMGSTDGVAIADSPPGLSWQGWLLRGAAGAMLYVGSYLIAGMLAYPFVRTFYESSASLPTPGTLIPFQLLVRGPLFVLAGALIIRLTRGSPDAQRLSVGLTLSLLGGVIPLLTPSPFFPDAVRWVHLVEVGGSNLIYGAVLAWLLMVRPARTPRLEATAS